MYEPLISALIGFASCLGAQFLIYRMTRGLLLSLMAAGIVGAVVVVVATDHIVESLLCYFPLWYCFLHFVNIGEASLRIRILDEIAQTPLSESDLLLRYNPETIITKRLERLLRTGDLREEGGIFRLYRSRLAAAGKVIHLVRLLLLGRARTYKLETFIGHVHILGGSGFVGRYVVRLLEQRGLNFRSYSSKDMNLLDANAADRLREQLKAGDVVMILASVTPRHGRDAKTQQGNVIMAQHLAQAFKGAAISQVVLLSSDAIYANELSPFREDVVTEAEDEYGRALLKRERAIQRACEENYIPLTIFRPCGIYGPGDPHEAYGPNRFLASARRQGVIQIFGQGEDLRDHVYVEDMAALLVAAVERSRPGVFNVATGQSVSFIRIAEWIQKRMGGVRLEFAPRSQLAIERRHDVRRLKTHFSECRIRSIEEGLASYLIDPPLAPPAELKSAVHP